jgi:hypothetical protein
MAFATAVSPSVFRREATAGSMSDPAGCRNGAYRPLALGSSPICSRIWSLHHFQRVGVRHPARGQAPAHVLEHFRRNSAAHRSGAQSRRRRRPRSRSVVCIAAKTGSAWNPQSPVKGIRAVSIAGVIDVCRQKPLQNGLVGGPVRLQRGDRSAQGPRPSRAAARPPLPASHFSPGRRRFPSGTRGFRRVRVTDIRLIFGDQRVHRVSRCRRCDQNTGPQPTENVS